MRDKVRVLTEDDLLQVLSWRNHPDVRRFMYSTHEISLEEHRNWFLSNQKSNRHILLIYEQDDKASGFIKFTPGADGSVCDWGFYLAPESPKGTGIRLGVTALEYAFNGLGVNKVIGEALAFNDKSIRFHKRLGFEEEARLKAYHFDGEKYNDVVRFGLMRKDWHPEKVK